MARGSVRALVVLAACLLWLIPASAAQAVSETQDFTGVGCQNWIVPSPVSSVQIEAVGMAGEAAPFFFGGSGGNADGVSATMAVAGGQTLVVCNDYDGGSAGSYAGNGGGGSSVAGVGANNSTTALVEAGGGGGGGSNPGGLNPEFLTGDGGAAGAEQGADGGGTEAPGAKGVTTGGKGGNNYLDQPGDGGTGQVSAGNGVGYSGAGALLKMPSPGGWGGSETASVTELGGGGGGGGFEAGGGGSTWWETNIAQGVRGGTGGGGGGTDYCQDSGPVSGCNIQQGAGTVYATGTEAGQAHVSLTYNLPAPTITVTTPAEGASYALGQVVDSSFTCSDYPGGPGFGGGGHCWDQNAKPSGSPIDTSTPGVHTYEVVADTTDGRTAAVEVHYQVDPPQSPTITTPANGATYVYGQDVTSSFSCADGAGAPGIATTNGCVDQNGNPSGSPIDTETVGTNTYSVTATSKDGATTTSTVTYTVEGATSVEINVPSIAGGSYGQWQLIDTNFACSGGGIVSCVDGNGNPSGTPLETSTLGPHTFTIVMTLSDGQVERSSYSYTVVAGPVPWGQLGPYTYGQTPVTLPGTTSSGATVSYSLAPIQGDGGCKLTNNADGSATLSIVYAAPCALDATDAGNGATYQRTISVSPAILHVDAEPLSVQYGEPLYDVFGVFRGSYSVRASDLVNGETAAEAAPGNEEEWCKLSGTTPTDAGTYADDIVCNPENYETGRYRLVEGNSADLTITKAPIHVDANNVSTPYGESPSPTYTLRASDFVDGDTAATSDITGGPLCYQQESDINAGTYPGVAHCLPYSLAAPNYTFVQGSNANFTITKVELPIDANAATTTYGTAPSLSYTLNPGYFRYEDTASSIGLTGSPDCTNSAGSENAGIYSGAISCAPGSLSSTNYTITQGTSADLTIKQATVHVDADPVTTVVGTAPTLGATLRASDFQYDDTASSSDITGSADCTDSAGSASVGVFSGAISCAPGSLSSPNYAFAQGTSADLRIVQVGLKTESSAVGASDLVDEVGYTASTALSAQSDTISVTAPAGVGLPSDVGDVSVYDATNGSGAVAPAAVSQRQSPNGAETDVITLPFGVAALDQLYIDFDGVSNVGPIGSGEWTLSTSQDPAVLTVGSQTLGSSSLSEFSAAASSSAARAKGVTYTVSFTTSSPLRSVDWQGTSVPPGDASQINVVLPAGATLPGGCATAQLTDRTTPSDSRSLRCVSVSGNTVTYALTGGTVAAGDAVSIAVTGVSNPATSVAGATVSASTTSDPGGASGAITGEAPPAPVINAVNPHEGPVAGGTAVVIRGNHLTGTTRVSFGGVEATDVEDVSSTEVRAVSPAHAAGTVAVAVATAGGESPNRRGDRFSYTVSPIVTSIEPDEGTTAGGTTVTIKGANLGGVAVVEFGGREGTHVHVISSTEVTVVSPAHAAGTVDIVVGSSGRKSATTRAARFRYLPPPMVTEVNPGRGPAAGGTVVTIRGTRLTGATRVRFGKAKGSDVKAISATEVKVKSPAHGAGTINVVVVTGGGKSGTGPADHFAYLGAPLSAR